MHGAAAVALATQPRFAQSAHQQFILSCVMHCDVTWAWQSEPGRACYTGMAKSTSNSTCNSEEWSWGLGPACRRLNHSGSIGIEAGIVIPNTHSTDDLISGSTQQARHQIGDELTPCASGCSTEVSRRNNAVSVARAVNCIKWQEFIYGGGRPLASSNKILCKREQQQHH
jgi:hypothetical protein